MTIKFREEDTMEQSLEALASRLDTHINEYELHKNEVTLQLQIQTNSLLQNTAAVTQLTESIAKLTEATAGVVEAYTTANNVQRFVKWLAAFGILAGVVTWSVKLLNQHFGG